MLMAGATQYPSSNANGELRYRYTLHVQANQPPAGNQAIPGQNPATMGGSQWSPAGSGMSPIWLNVLSPAQAVMGPPQVLTSPIFSPSNPSVGWFSFNDISLQGTRWYFQVLVDEYYQNSQGQWVPNGRRAASRGHWIGVARP